MASLLPLHSIMEQLHPRGQTGNEVTVALSNSITFACTLQDSPKKAMRQPFSGLRLLHGRYNPGHGRVSKIEKDNNNGGSSGSFRPVAVLL